MSRKVINKFIAEYKDIYPDEWQPNIEEIDMLKKITTIKIESKHNLIYAKEAPDRIEIFAHWCLAHKSKSSSFNMKAFREVLRFARIEMTKPVIITNLNEKYYKSTVYYSDRYRRF